MFETGVNPLGGGVSPDPGPRNYTGIPAASTHTLSLSKNKHGAAMAGAEARAGSSVKTGIGLPLEGAWRMDGDC